MRRNSKKIFSCDINLPSVSSDAEGKLSGGFAGIGHLAVMGIPKNDKCANVDCTNGTCTNSQCANSSCTNAGCINLGC